MGADGVPPVDIQETAYEQGDALKAEIEAFLEAATGARAPAVSGEDGLKALIVALTITEQVTRAQRES
jgi:predicted dehydrogenase